MLLGKSWEFKTANNNNSYSVVQFHFTITLYYTMLKINLSLEKIFILTICALCVKSMCWMSYHSALHKVIHHNNWISTLFFFLICLGQTAPICVSNFVESNLNSKIRNNKYSFCYPQIIIQVVLQYPPISSL